MKTVKLTVAVREDFPLELQLMAFNAGTSVTEQIRQAISNRHNMRGKRVFVEDACGCRQEVKIP